VRRRLDAELVRRGLARSRGHAADLIRAGRVTVAGAPAAVPARLVRADDALHIGAAPSEYVSRGGFKLAHGLDTFGLDVADRRALDAGASTGGFTDCLLQRGAREVVAVDVGHGQLAWSLRNDARVVVFERTNIRTVTADDLGGPFDVIVADLSFISLRTVAPSLRDLGAPGAEFVFLVKPQFEAGPDRVGRGGIVRDPVVRHEVVVEVVDGLAVHGLGVCGLTGSPITGAAGNVEFLAWARAGATPMSPSEIAGATGPVGQTGT